MKSNIIKVRVRGIYATALTKILLDKGFIIVQASPIIRQRFNIPENNVAPDLTIKTTDDPHTLLVIGFPQQVDETLRILREELKYIVVWVSKLGLYSTVIGRVIDRRGDECIVKLPFNLTGILGNCNDKPGSIIPVAIAKTATKPKERIMLTRNIRVIGYYAALIKGSNRITISEHIRDPERKAELITLSSNIVREGYGVHWRSSAGRAEIQVLLRELEELKKEINNIIEKASKASEGEIVYEGEKIALITITSPAKQVLDTIRSEVVATIPGHHSYKALGGELSNIVDYAEKLVENEWITPEHAGKGVLYYIAEKLKNNKRIELIHVKPDGTAIRLTPGKPESVVVKNNHIIVELKRIIKTPGVYDGLKIEKEPGDYDIVRIDSSSWTIIHKYHDRYGNLKGEYININTPPEIGVDKIIYQDLALDIVKKPDGTIQLTDIEEYGKLVRDGIITKYIHEKVLEILEEYGVKTEQIEQLSEGKL